MGLCVLLSTGLFLLADFYYLQSQGNLPNFREIWGLAFSVPLINGAAVTLGAGGASLVKRVIGGALCGGLVGLLHSLILAALGYGAVAGGSLFTEGVWRGFIFTIFSTLGVLITELALPEPPEKSEGG